MDGKRRVNVPPPEPRVPNMLGRFVKRGCARVLRGHGVNVVTKRSFHYRLRSFPPDEIDWIPGGPPYCGSASGTAVFTSDIAIIGRNRTKSRNNEVKIPSVP